MALSVFRSCMHLAQSNFVNRNYTNAILIALQYQTSHKYPHFHQDRNDNLFPQEVDLV